MKSISSKRAKDVPTWQWRATFDAAESRTFLALRVWPSRLHRLGGLNAMYPRRPSLPAACMPPVMKNVAYRQRP